MRMYGRTIHMPNHPATQLAILIADGHHSTRERRNRLAALTVDLARQSTEDCARRHMIPWCDVDCVAVDAAAWCVSSQGVHAYDPRLGTWATYVALAVLREAISAARRYARQARSRRAAAAAFPQDAGYDVELELLRRDMGRKDGNK